MDTVWELVEFLVESVIVVAAFIAAASFFFGRLRERRHDEPIIRLRDLGARWRRNANHLAVALSPSKERKRVSKELNAREKQAGDGADRARVFVVDFKSDILASEVESLREQVTSIISMSRPGDEVVLRLESGGGAVHGYGLAASQLARLRDRQISLTVCVDKIAASGGYMMACVAEKILAAPFAVLGSIGVLAPVPNVHRLLDKLGVDYEDVTAGKYKRTVSLMGPVTAEGRAKLKEQIEETHELFKQFVAGMRPKIDIEAVATGEHWYGTRAIELGLVDVISTSDDYLYERAEGARVLEVLCDRPTTPREKVLGLVRATLTRWLD